jgi:hypothetical protein
LTEQLRENPYTVLCSMKSKSESVFDEHFPASL